VTVLVVIVVVAVVAVVLATRQALEKPRGGPPAATYFSGPKVPRVLIIGDSISATREQQDSYAVANMARKVGTEVRATVSFTIADHLHLKPRDDNDFNYAHRNPRHTVTAVVVELGTNDMHAVLTAKKEQVVFNTIAAALETMSNKCVVWLGLNTVHPSVLGVKNPAHFNHFLWSNSKEQGGRFENLHYADYNHLVKTNADVRAALDHDGQKLGIHFGGATAPAARTAVARFVAASVAKFCG
jgi:hypothetical protein